MSKPVALERSLSPLGDGGFLEAMRRFLAIEASEPILALVTRVFARLLYADRATLRLIEGGRPMEAASCGEESTRLGQGIEHEWGLWPLVALGEPVVVSDPVRDARLSPRLREAFERVPYRSLLAMPLSREGTVVGVLEAFTRRPQGFSEADRSFAASLAAHASAMLFGPPRLAAPNVDLLAANEDSAKRIEEGEVDAMRLLQLLADSACRVFRARIGIWILVEDGVLTERIASPQESMAAGRVLAGEGLAGHCAQARHGMIVDHIPRWIHATPNDVLAGVRHAMVEPLLVRGRLAGVITAGRSEPAAAPFVEADLEMLRRLGEPLGVVARELARSEETDQRRREAEALARIAHALSEHGDVVSVCQQIVDRVMTLLPITAALIVMEEPNGDLRGVARSGDLDLAASDIVLPRGGGVAGRAMLMGRMVSSDDVLSDPSLALPDYLRERLIASGQRALLAVPLGSPGRALGALTVANRNAIKFSDGERRLLEALADQATLALENARLHEDAERRRKEAETIAQGTRALVGMHDALQVVGRIVESAPALLPGCVHAAIAVPRPEGILEAVVVGGPLSALLRPGGRVTKGSLVNRVWQEHQPTWTSDLMAEPEPAEPELAERHHVFLRAGVRAYLALPLSVRGHTVGVLGMAFNQPRLFVGDDFTTGQTLANQAALALDNARLYEEAERRRREAEVMAEISRTINASLDVDTVLQQVVEGARTLCRSDGARIALREAETGIYPFRYWVDPQHAGYADRLAETGAGSLAELVRQRRRPVRATASDISHEGFGAQMAVPILIGDEIEGLLYVDNRSPRPFTDLDEGALVLLAEHAAVALRNARLFTEAQATGRRLQAVSRRLLEVQEAERRHLSRELHDEVGQALTAVKMNLQMLRRQSPPKQATGRLDESIGLVDRILHGVRQLSLDLRPSLLDDLGLAAALRWYVSAQAERSGIAADVATEPLPDNVPIAITTTCFRVAQEAVTNALRHARATRIAVTLRCEGEELEVSVGDNGVGFDVAAARSRAMQGASAGLLGLEERVQLAGGRSSIASVPGWGTMLHAWLPLSNPSPPNSQATAEGIP